MTRLQEVLSQYDPPTTDWEINNAVDVSYSDLSETLREAEKVKNRSDALKQIFKPGLTVKFSAFQLRNEHTRQTRTFLYMGGGVGAGINLRSAGLSGFSKFETARPVRFADFGNKFARYFGISAGVGPIGYAPISGIVIQGIDVRRTAWEKFWYGDQIPTGGWQAGTGFDISYTGGFVVPVAKRTHSRHHYPSQVPLILKQSEYAYRPSVLSEYRYRLRRPEGLTSMNIEPLRLRLRSINEIYRDSNPRPTLGSYRLSLGGFNR